MAERRRAVLLYDYSLPEVFHLVLIQTFLSTFKIDRIKSFLAKSRLPQFGQTDKKDTYSDSLVLLQLCLHDKHFISVSYAMNPHGGK